MNHLLRVRGTRLALAGAVAVCTLAASTVSFGAVSAGAATGSGRILPVHPHAAAAPASATRAALTGAVHYAVNEPLCSSGTYTCDALRRVPVAKGTPGAYAYTLPAYQRGPAGGLTPADLAKAYGYNPNTQRRYQTVAVVNWFDDPHALADLNRFDTHYGFPRETARSFRKVNQAGRTSPLPHTSRASAGEISLDIETVRAVCHTCRILLVEADNGTDSDLATAENTAARLGATEISNSFGSDEHAVSRKVRNAFNHPGVVITASTGDAGWYGWDSINDGVRSPGRASYPSTDPHVVAVGATSLALSASGARLSETVWNGDDTDDSVGVQRGSQGASGGGCSTIYAAGTWQRQQPGYAAAQCGGKRLAADISAVGDPSTGFDVVNTFGPAGYPAWGTVGGTSLSSPLIAAMWALAGGAHGSAYPAASLYLNARNHSGTVYDVTAGGNSFCGGDDTATCASTLAGETRPSTNNPNGFGAGTTDCSFPRSKTKVSSAPAKRSECNATTGYDGASGLGTPTGTALFRATNPSVSITRPARLDAGRPGFFTAKVVEHLTGVQPTSYRWSFDGGGVSTSGRPGVRHTFGRKGSHRVDLQVTDSSGQSTVTHTYITVR